MGVEEVWIEMKEYHEKYEEEYPKYQIKINNNVILYKVENKFFYLLEDAFEYLDEKEKE